MTTEAEVVTVSTGIEHNLCSLIAVLEKYNRQKVEITLPKSSNCLEFWKQLTSDIYYHSTFESRLTPDNEHTFDHTVRAAMYDFRENDTLDVLTKKGRILKRFANHYKTMWGHKIPDDLQGIIGDKLQYYLMSSSEKRFVLDFTDRFDWNDGQFGKRGSCWWGSYSDSIPTFENGGGWAVRYYQDMSDTNGIGRTWILPKDDVLICFNSYGIERPQVSKTIKQLFYENGITLHYKPVAVQNSENDSIPYINSGSGFILYPDWISDNEVSEEYDLNLTPIEDERVECYYCDSRIDPDSACYYNDTPYCQGCYNDRFSMCEMCNETYHNSDLHSTKDGQNLCRECAREDDLILCAHCEKWINEESAVLAVDYQNYYCEECAHNSLVKCEECGQHYGSYSRYARHVKKMHTPVPEFDYVSSQMETVVVACDEITTLVHRYEKTPGVFIVERDDRYTIVHEESGLTLRAYIDEFWQAVEIVSRISGHDWTRDRDAIVYDASGLSTLRQAILDVLGQ